MIEGQDRRLLTHLQKDGRRSNQDLADDVGMSSSACWRRVKALEEAVQGCRGCELYKDATQAVFGDGRKSAELMLVPFGRSA